MAQLQNIKSQQKSIYERQTVTLLDSIKINSINIKGNEKYTRSYLIGKLKFKDEEKISLSDLRKGINNLIATNNFDTFRYFLKPSTTDYGYNLVGDIRESKTSTFLKLGIHYDGLYKSSVLANLTKKRLLFDNDIASLDLILGDNSRYNFDYFIDKGFYISVGIKSRYNHFNKNINPLLALEEDSPLLTGLNKIDVELSDFTNQIFLQTIFRRDFALRAGLEHKRLKITSETITEDNEADKIIFEKTDYFSVYGNLIFDDYDNVHFPKNGFYFNGDFHLYVDASHFNSDFKEFSIAKADIGYAFSFSDNLALKTETSGGFKIGDKSTTTLGFGLGGYGENFINNFHSFYGYD